MIDIFENITIPDSQYKRLVNLWRCVVMQAVKDVSDDSNEISQDAYEWIKNNDKKCFNSFLNLCNLCEVDAKKIRAILKRKSCFLCGRKTFITKIIEHKGEYFCKNCFQGAMNGRQT